MVEENDANNVIDEIYEDGENFGDEFLLRDDRRRREEYFALKAIRRESQDTYSRLHSISEDAEFVQTVHKNYPTFPVIPNLRCGAWYVDPEIVRSGTAYFKSTDGHFGNWDFNLRRPNLHLLPLLVDHHGIVLVDSTRSGKRIPDALSKTVPIWCVVINRALLLLGMSSANWDTDLHTFPGSVSKQEHAQIESKIQQWIETLLNSSYTLPHLERPIRPIWITPATSNFPEISSSFYPVICVSASHLVEQGLERRRDGFAYVQGSGDDHESWSQGLTPSLFWAYKNELLQASQSDLSDLITTILSHQTKNNFVQSSQAAPIQQVNGCLSIGSIVDVLNTNTEDKQKLHYIIITSNLQSDFVASTKNLKSSLVLNSLPGKRGEIKFRTTDLPAALEFIKTCLYNNGAVCILCDTGTDLSVGIGIAALQMFFDADGKLLMPDQKREESIDKHSIRMRLEWIIASRPQANPSRATMKRVNEYFMSPSKSFRPVHPGTQTLRI